MKRTAKTTLLIDEEEGCKLKAYPDTGGIPSIGYGSTWINGRRVLLTDSITQEEADRIRDEYLDTEEKELSKVLEAEQVILNPDEFDACMDFCYQFGVPAFHGSGLFHVIKQNPSDREGISAQFRRWVHGEENGRMVVLDDLVRRREKEISLYFTGTWIKS